MSTWLELRDLLRLLPSRHLVSFEGEVCCSEGCEEVAIVLVYGGCGEHVPHCFGHAYLDDDLDYEDWLYAMQRKTRGVLYG